MLVAHPEDFFGRHESARLLALGRGFGHCPVCVYQDIGQIRNNLGPTGAMTLSASADIDVHLGGGISDLETARHLSAKLGNQTLKLDDHLTQHRAQREMRLAMHDALFRNKGGAIRTGLVMKALDYERGHRARHILDGEGRIGGHRFGKGTPCKTEFPQTWSDDDIVDAIKQIAGTGEVIGPAYREGDLLITGEVERVLIEVVVTPNGEVRTGYPVSGEGVVDNPR